MNDRLTPSMGFQWKVVENRPDRCAVSFGRVAALALLLGPGVLRAQTDPLYEPWRWVRFTTESGLPAGRVADVVETSAGVPWAATDHGLAWYDGFRWHPITAAEGMPPGPVFKIVPDLQGGVLVISDGRLYRGSQQGLTRIPVQEDGRPIKVGAVAPLVDEDIIILSQAALYRHGPEGLRAFPVPQVSEQTAEPLHQLWRTHAGTLWLAALGGTFEWTGTRWVRRFERPAGFLHVDDSGVILALNDPPGQGLWTWALDPATRPQRLAEESPSFITALDVSPIGEALVADTSRRMRVRRDGQWEWLSPVPTRLADARLLRFQRNGDLWVGTDQGLFLHRGSSSRWTNWYHPGPAAANQVHSILKTSDGDVWIGTAAGVFIHRPDGSVEHITSVNGVELGIVTGLVEDRRGDIWISSGADFWGAFRRHENTWRRYGPKDGLGAPRVHKIVLDRRGRLWFLGLSTALRASQGRDPGAFVYDGERFVRWGTDEGLPSGRVYSFAEGPDGALWFGTSGGLSRWLDGGWTHWTTDQGLPANRVFALAVDDDGRVWFGHQHGRCGLSFLDDQDRPGHFTTAEGLIDNQVWELQFGPDGTLWIGTSDGLSRYRDGTFASLGTASGLDRPSVWPVLPLDDRVYVGTIGGGVYTLSLEEADNPPPAVTVSPVLVDGKTVFCRWQAFGFRGELPTSRIETRHRLDREAWSHWSITREATAANVPVGEHTFTVQAKSLFGNVDAAGTTVTFRIPPPFFEHPIFITAVGLWLVSTVGVVGVYWRKRRTHHRLLRERETHFRSLMENASDLITVLDRKGAIRYQSPSVEHVLGYAVTEFEDRSVFDLIHPQDRAAVRWLLSRRAGSDGAARSVELRVAHRDGTWRTIEAVGKAVVEADGTESVVINSRDITERKRAEVQRRQLEEQLLQSQKMEAVGTLAAGVAHDFYNLLTAILGYAGIARANVPREHETHQALANIEQAAHQAAGVTKSLLTFSRKTSTVKAPVSLGKLVDDSVGMLRRMLPAAIDFVANVPQSPEPWVDAGATQLQQVIMNLVINARDAMPDGGRLRISVRHQAVETGGVFATVAKGGRGVAVIEIEDSGVGIPEEVRSRLFEPFFTTKARSQGTGLGLAVVHGIVAEHQGHIEVHSQEGRGTRFTVGLPCCDPPDPSAPTTSDETRVVGRGETVLVVEDNQQIQAIMATTLESVGFRVVQASDGAEALDLFKANEASLRLVILDLDLPKMSGPSCLNRMRQARPDLPAILTSGHPTATPDAPRTNNTVFMSKPFRMSELAALVSRMLTEAQTTAVQCDADH